MSARVTTKSALLDRFFDAVPLRPYWIALLLAIVFVASLAFIVTLSGDMAEFVAEERRWWELRDARLGILLALLAAWLPTVRRYERMGARNNLEELRTSVSWRPGDFEAAERAFSQPDSKRMLRWSSVGLLLPPIFALLVDRDPTLYFREDAYWGAPQVWSWSMGAIAGWNAGALVYLIAFHRRCFGGLAASIPKIDFFELGKLAPFTRQALRACIPGLLLLSFVAFQSVDSGFIWVVGVIGPIALALAVVPPVVMLRGIAQRLRRAKSDELLRIAQALRGDSDAMRGSSLGERATELGFGDLLAYRSFVSNVPEWPTDGTLRFRVLVYAAIPIGSWLGGAFVERLLDVALD